MIMDKEKLAMAKLHSKTKQYIASGYLTCYFIGVLGIIVSIFLIKDSSTVYEIVPESIIMIILGLLIHFKHSRGAACAAALFYEANIVMKIADGTSYGSGTILLIPLLFSVYGVFLYHADLHKHDTDDEKRIAKAKRRLSYPIILSYTMCYIAALFCALVVIGRLQEQLTITQYALLAICYLILGLIIHLKKSPVAAAIAVFIFVYTNIFFVMNEVESGLIVVSIVFLVLSIIGAWGTFRYRKDLLTFNTY